MCYLVRPGDQILTEDHGISLFVKLWVQILVRIKEKSRLVNIARNFLIILNNALQMNLIFFFKKSD